MAEKNEAAMEGGGGVADVDLAFVAAGSPGLAVPFRTPCVYVISGGQTLLSLPVDESGLLAVLILSYCYEKIVRCT